MRKLNDKERIAAFCILGNGFRSLLVANCAAYETDDLSEENRRLFINTILNSTNVFFDFLEQLIRQDEEEDDGGAENESYCEIPRETF